MTAEGARYFIILFAAVLPLIGFVTEFLLCRTKNAKIKLVLPVLGFSIYIINGFITGDFISGIFGPITIGAVIMLIIDYLWSNRKAK